MIQCFNNQCFLSKNNELKLKFSADLIFGKKEELNIDKFNLMVSLIFGEIGNFFKSADHSNNLVKKLNMMNQFKNQKYNENFNSLSFFQNTNNNSFSSVGIKSKCELCFGKLNQESANTTRALALKQMEKAFIMYERQNEGVFSLSLLQKMIEDIEMDQFFVKSIILYLKSKTGKTFLNFKQLSEFLFKFSPESKEKERIIFEIITYPDNYIDNQKLIKILHDLNIQTEGNIIEINEKLYWDNFKQIRENEIFKSLNSFDNLYYLLFIYFKVVPDIIDQKKCVGIIMKGEYKLTKFVINNLHKEKELYIIDSNFWNDWQIYVNWNNDVNHQLNNRTQNSVPKIDIRNLVENGTLSRLKPSFAYTRDYYFVTKSLWEMFSSWFFTPNQPIIRQIISYHESYKNIQNIDIIINEGLAKTEKETVYEIEVYPIFSSIFLLDDLISQEKIKSTSHLIDFLNKSSENNISHSLNSFSRFHTVSQIKKEIENYYVLGNQNTRIWSFYQKELISLNDIELTLQQLKINNFCIFLIETKSIEWTMDLIGQPNHSDVFSQRNYVGLSNLGNTCYLNSALQILLNNHELKDLIFSEDFKRCLNLDNKYGFKGKVFNEFYIALREKWSEKQNANSTLNLKKLKDIISSHLTQFKGNDQHDCHDFLIQFLDMLHEELNLNSEKAYISNPEAYNGDDKELANEYWANNLRRNLSYIHSLFLGQLKSTLFCNVCNTKKISFETFLSLSLPIPEKREIVIEVILHRIPYSFRAYSSYESKFNILEKISGLSILEENQKNNYETIDDSIISTPIPIRIKVPIQRNLRILDLIEKIQKLSEVELGKNKIPLKFLILINGCIYFENSVIDDCLQDNQIIHIHEIIDLSKFNENNSEISIELDSKGESEEILMRSTINEPLIEIKHRFPKKQNEFVIRNYEYCNIDTFKAFIFFKNHGVLPIVLYRYILSKYEFLFNDLNSASSSKFNELNHFPFTISVLNKRLNTCPNCIWHKFCSGCVIDPNSESLLKIETTCLITVNWCINSYLSEINNLSFKLIINDIESTNKQNIDDFKCTIFDCLSQFMENELLSSELFCTKCNTHTKFLKKYDLERLPPILTLVPKRFKYTQGFRRKIDTNVDFPIRDLDLNMFLTGSDINNKSKYNLFAVIYHSGNLNSGHYTSVVNHDNKWIKYDDTFTHDISENLLRNSQAYILVYKKQDIINEENNDYLRLLNTVYFRNSSQYVKGEPVTTQYGKGYISEVYHDEKTFENHLRVKHRYGFSIINITQNSEAVKKELVYVRKIEKQREIKEDKRNSCICF